MNRPWARSSTPLDFLLPLAAPRFPVRPFLEPGVNLFATFSKAIIAAIVYDVFIVAVTVLVFYFFCALFLSLPCPPFLRPSLLLHLLYRPPPPAATTCRAGAAPVTQPDPTASAGARSPSHPQLSAFGTIPTSLLHSEGGRGTGQQGACPPRGSPRPKCPSSLCTEEGEGGGAADQWGEVVVPPFPPLLLIRRPANTSWAAAAKVTLILYCYTHTAAADAAVTLAPHSRPRPRLCHLHTSH